MATKLSRTVTKGDETELNQAINELYEQLEAQLGETTFIEPPEFFATREDGATVYIMHAHDDLTLESAVAYIVEMPA